jgi:hypothetical protein
VLRVASPPAHTVVISPGSTNEVAVALNVILDVILDRRGMIPAHGITTIFYLIEKACGGTFARKGVERLISVFGVAPVNEDVVRRALMLAWPDGYPDAPLPVVDPAAALIWLKG